MNKLTNLRNLAVLAWQNSEHALIDLNGMEKRMKSLERERVPGAFRAARRHVANVNWHVGDLLRFAASLQDQASMVERKAGLRLAETVDARKLTNQAKRHFKVGVEPKRKSGQGPHDQPFGTGVAGAAGESAPRHRAPDIHPTQSKRKRVMKQQKKLTRKRLKAELRLARIENAELRFKLSQAEADLQEERDKGPYVTWKVAVTKTEDGVWKTKPVGEWKTKPPETGGRPVVSVPSVFTPSDQINPYNPWAPGGIFC